MDGGISRLNQCQDKTILVVGDVMLDQYTFGDVSHISPEAPVPVLQKSKDTFVPGGAANVASNITALGARAVLVGVVGDDKEKDILQQLVIDRGVDAALIVDATRPTTLKHRVVTGDNHQFLRIDRESTDAVDATVEDNIFSHVASSMEVCDAVILSDYAKGLFTKRLTHEILARAKKLGKKVYADIKPENKNLFVGVDLVTPNLKESEEMSGSKNVTIAGKQFAQHFDANVFVTRGKDGISVFDIHGEEFRIPSRRVSVYDVSGAGDTVLAVAALTHSSGIDLVSSAICANTAAGVVVQKPGTATLSLEELISALDTYNHLEGAYTVEKVWGHEKWIENNDKYCSKILVLHKGYQCSMHYHKIKDETFLIQSGHVRFELNDKIIHMREGNFVRIKPGDKHRFTGIEDSVILEISTHHDEEDSYRLSESRAIDIERI